MGVSELTAHAVRRLRLQMGDMGSVPKKGTPIQTIIIIMGIPTQITRTFGKLPCTLVGVALRIYRGMYYIGVLYCGTMYLFLVSRVVSSTHK